MNSASPYTLVILLNIIIFTGLLTYCSRHRKIFFKLNAQAAMGLGILGTFSCFYSNNLFAIFLGLEVHAFSLIYLLKLFSPQRKTIEASIKFYIFESFSAALLLFGLSLFYGYFGSLNVTNMQLLTSPSLAPTWLNLGFLCIATSFLFKLGLIPFHFWIPDVYEAAPTPLVFYISTAPKVILMTILIRIAPILSMVTASWFNILLQLSIISIIIGNILALSQINMKRLFAYASINQSAFLTLCYYCLLQQSEELYAATQGIELYLASYILAFAVIFGILNKLEDKEDYIILDDLVGLGKKSPMLSLLMLLSLLSLVGLPPSLGFFAKITVLQTLLETGDFISTMLIASGSIIGLYYTLRIISAIYLEPSKSAKINDDLKRKPYASNTL